MTDEIKYIVSICLQHDWSPEQIVGRLREEEVVSLHHETIYQYLLADKANGGQLYKQLRHQEKTYRKRYGSAHNRTGIPDRRDIDERPAAETAGNGSVTGKRIRFRGKSQGSCRHP